MLLLLCCSETPEELVDAGELSDAWDGSLGLDGEVSPDSNTSDAGMDTSMNTRGTLCAGVADGQECGVHRECRDGECVFDQPDVPCGYDFSAAAAGAFLIIACDHDLAGESVQLAPDITLEYNGGSIINGQLETNGTAIDGELLNLSLEIVVEGGSALLDPFFAFRKQRWDIEEGAVSDEVAVNNRDQLNAAIERVKGLSGHTFTIDQIDVFLDVATGPFSDRPIRVPSDFCLRMSENTHIRVQANDHREYSLIATQDTSSSAPTWIS